MGLLARGFQQSALRNASMFGLSMLALTSACALAISPLNSVASFSGRCLFHLGEGHGSAEGLFLPLAAPALPLAAAALPLAAAALQLATAALLLAAP